MAISADNRVLVAQLPTLSLPAELREQWNTLAGDIPFRRLEWLESWWRSYGQDDHARSRRRELFTLAVLVDGQIIGLAPWYREYGPAAGHAIRFLGAGDVCSEYLGLMVAPGREGEVGEALADAITERRDIDRGTGVANPSWDLLEFKSSRLSDPAIVSLLSCLEAKGCSVHRRHGPPCWRIDLPRDWETYLRRLSHSHRKQARRIERRYFDTGRVRLYRADDEASLAQALDILTKLHQSRWESRREPGCFSDRRFAAFMFDAARQQLASGDLSLHWLELDGCPIAAEYHMTSARTVYAYQSGIDPQALDHEPGRMITLALVRQAIAEGREMYDFLRGDEPYKAHFRARPVAVSDVRVAPPTASARLRNTLWLAGDNMKHWLKTGLGLNGAMPGPQATP